MVFEEDTRAMVRLLGKIVVINGPPAEKRRQLMRGICELIGGGGCGRGWDGPRKGKRLPLR